MTPKLEQSKVRDIDRENLIDIFRNFDSDMNVEFIAQFPHLWQDCYDISEESRYHEVMINSMLAGYDTKQSSLDQANERMRELGSWSRN